MPKRLLPVVTAVAMTVLAFAHSATAGDGSGVYWVDPVGTALWSDCESATALNGTACCSLDSANSSASAGDLINLRGGTYGSEIRPSNSGTREHRITYQAYNHEEVIISGTYDIITLNSVDYIVVDGIEGRNPTSSYITITNYADYNEVRNCTIYDDDGITVRKGVQIWGICPGGSTYTCYATHNWIHDNTFYMNGHVTGSCNDEGALMYIGSTAEIPSGSHYNTLENNVMYWGGHHVLETYTKYNVIRNNVMHNEGWMVQSTSCSDKCGTSGNGKYGNRNIQVYDMHGESGKYNVIEGNRLGHAALPPDDAGANNLVITSRRNIVRYNLMFNADRSNLHLKCGSGGNASSQFNVIYNNTLYHTTGLVWLQNCNSHSYNMFLSSCTDYNVIKNNLLYDAYTGDYNASEVKDNTIANNWLDQDGDPQFTDPDMSDPMSTTRPDLSLRPDSSAIDQGTHLTQADGSGARTTSLTVDNALFFQDGTWGSALSDIQADWIAIGTVSNTVQISAIDYAGNTITLASPNTWDDDAPIWLYKRSDATQVLYGLAPDYGAHEYAPTTLQGDLNGDGLVNVQDVQACANHILGTQDLGEAADVNGDERVDATDAQRIVDTVLSQ